VSQHAVGSLESLPNNAGFKLEIADERIAIFRVDDAVYAIGDRCSHAEASLSEGELFDLEVECPRHGAEFDITTGRQLSLPATKPVPTYETAIRDGQVFVTIEDEDTDE
jgi:3-phenylpropionate/trans-cinnamate dioxygenase ferredoxin subunit